jgi:hypothetical protein
MSSLNQRLKEKMQGTNHVSLPVRTISTESKLKRMTLAHMLWENQFYIDGESSAEILKNLVAVADPTFVSNLAQSARTEYKLRHVPLYLIRELARTGRMRAEMLDAVIQRPDEMGEFLSIYWKDGKSAISNQVKNGLAKAFNRFNEYQLAKWDKNNSAVSVRDVMFMCHPKPTDIARAELFKRIAAKELVTPDTWEVALSNGADKLETFSRLMDENKLGALAFLRNLRNMTEAGVNESKIRAYAMDIVNIDMVLPFRYVAAAKHVPQLEDMLEEMMLRSLAKAPKIPGKTVLLVDVSGSMFGTTVSAKSELDRFDAAAALAMLCREICEEVEIYTFSDECIRVSPRHGFALREQLQCSQPHGGTDTGSAIDKVNKGSYDRVIVFTDEQSYTRLPNPKGKGYVVNVAAYENGINSGVYETVSGFSEAVLEYIRLSENMG